MSDHPDVPRVEFNSDGMSMNIEEAVDEFRRILLDFAEDQVPIGPVKFRLNIEMRECDCDSDITGRDEGCPLHGDPEVLRA